MWMAIRYQYFRDINRAGALESVKARQRGVCEAHCLQTPKANERSLPMATADDATRLRSKDIRMTRMRTSERSLFAGRR